MDRSDSTTEGQMRRTQLRKRLGALAAAGVAGCALVYAMTAPAPAPSTPPLAAAAGAIAPAGSAPAEALKPGQRRVYPYSIVPGGVAGAQELGRVIREDKVVAAHYAEFDLSKARETTVGKPRAVHVSYRKGDKVYWTAKKVMLAEGETLLTDGTHEARARCANQISDTPRLPVEAHGPSAEELDSSVVENDPSTDGSLETVSAGMLDGQGMPGGFLNAPGSGGAGGILAGGGALESPSLLAGAAQAPGPAGGAYLSSRSGSTRAAPGKEGEESSSGSNAGENSGSGSGGNGSGGTPKPSDPAGGSTGGDAPGTTPAPTPAAQPAKPQPATPATPGAGENPATPGLPNTTPTTPELPSLPGVPSPLTPSTPGTPDGGQAGGGGSGTPKPPSTDLGVDPLPGRPDSSPVPEPTLTPPKEPVQPGEDPARPVEVPEPGTGWLVGAALALMLVLRRRERRGA